MLSFQMSETHSFISFKKKTRMYCNNTHVRRQTGYSQTYKCRWRFLTPHLSAEKTCCPLKCNFLKQDTWIKMGRVFFLLCPPITARRALWKLRPGFPQALWQAWASSLFFSDKGGGGWRGWWWGDGGVFVCPCEREGGGGETGEEGWIDRKRDVRGERRRRCRNVGVGGYCRRKRHKQLINQHRKETGIQTVEQRWRRTDTDRWGQGRRAGLPLSAQLAVAGRTPAFRKHRCPLPLDILIGLSVCLSGPWRGI